MTTISNELREDRWILVEDRHLREAKFTRQWLQLQLMLTGYCRIAIRRILLFGLV